MGGAVVRALRCRLYKKKTWDTGFQSRTAFEGKNFGEEEEERPHCIYFADAMSG